MRLDVDGRLAAGFIFGIVGLTLETVSALLGGPVSAPLVGAFSTIVVATFGVGLITGQTPKKPDQTEEENEEEAE